MQSWPAASQADERRTGAGSGFTNPARADFPFGMHVHHEYPKWKYHATEAARIVHDPAAEDALGEAWADSPAAFAEEDTTAATVATDSTQDEDEGDTLSPDKSTDAAAPVVKKKTRKG